MSYDQNGTESVDKDLSTDETYIVLSQEGPVEHLSDLQRTLIFTRDQTFLAGAVSGESDDELKALAEQGEIARDVNGHLYFSVPTMYRLFGHQMGEALELLDNVARSARDTLGLPPVEEGEPVENASQIDALRQKLEDQLRKGGYSKAAADADRFYAGAEAMLDIIEDAYPGLARKTSFSELIAAVEQRRATVWLRYAPSQGRG